MHKIRPMPPWKRLPAEQVDSEAVEQPKGRDGLNRRRDKNRVVRVEAEARPDTRAARRRAGRQRKVAVQR